MRFERKNLGLVANSMILAFVRCITYASSFVQVMIMSRVFDKFEYGSYSQACTIVTVISPFFLLGLSNAATYFYNQNCEERQKYVETIYNLILVLGLSGGIFIVVFHNPIASYFSNLTLIPLIYIVAFRPLFQNLISLFQVLYISSDRAMVVAVRNTVLSFIQIGIIVIAAYFFRSVELVLFLLVFTDFLQVIILNFFFSKSVMSIRILKLDILSIRRIMTYALPLALSTMIGTLTINMDMMLIGRIMSTETFALYSNMAKELPFNFLISSFTDVVFPKIINLNARGDKETLIRTYHAYVELGIILTWILIGGAIVCSQELILVLYSPKYLEGIAIFVVYLLVSASRFTYYGMMLSVYGKSKDIMVVSVIVLISNLILNIILFYLMGIIGPAIATLISVFIGAFLQLNKGLKLLGIAYKSIFRWGYITRFVIGLVIVGILFFILKSYLIYVPLLFRLLLVYSGYVIFMILLNSKKIKENAHSLNNIFC